METISTTVLSIIFLICVLLSGFFSSAETGMMSLNRYRLKHLVQKKKRGAIFTQKLLDRPDRLLGLILIGNNFVNFFAASVIGIICVRTWGEVGLLIAPFLLTAIVLIFAEVTPKTLAAIHPEKIALRASFILMPLYKIFFPLVIGLNSVCNSLLKLFGIKVEDGVETKLNTDELKTIVNEAGLLIPKRHQKMLISILDLEKETVEDIMIPNAEIIGIDIEKPVNEIIARMKSTVHTRLPVYSDSIDNIEGFLHARQMIKLLAHSEKELTKEVILKAMTPAYFIPEGTPLNTQLLNFQRKKFRVGLVVDEYGDILGLVTIEDILEEIVGEFTTDLGDTSQDIQKEKNGSITIDGSTTIRDINRTLGWRLPRDGPKTLNGLIIEYYESIPQEGMGMRLSGYPVEVLQVKSNIVKSVRVWPALYQMPATDDD